MKALVTGATGYVGSRLVAALVQAGHEVVATARNLDKLQKMDWEGAVTTAELDVLDDDSVRSALRNAGNLDVAYYLVHALGEGDYETSDEKAAHLFTEAAADTKIGRIVYLGGFVPADGAMSSHLASRSRVGEVLESGPVDTVLLQAAVILGAGSTSFEIVRHLVDRLPVVPLPRFMNHQVQPIAVDDVLYYLIAAADPGALPAGSYEIAGNERITYAGLARTYARVARLRRLFVPVPFVPERLAAAAMGPLIPVPNALVSDLVQSLSTSMISQDPTIHLHIPDPDGGLTTLSDAVRRALRPADARTASGKVGVQDLDDSLTLAATDADWAGNDPKPQG